MAKDINDNEKALEWMIMENLIEEPDIWKLFIQ